MHPLVSISKCANQRGGRSPVSTGGRLQSSFIPVGTRADGGRGVPRTGGRLQDVSSPPAVSRRVKGLAGGRLQIVDSRSGGQAGDGRARSGAGGRLQASIAASARCFSREEGAGWSPVMAGGRLQGLKPMFSLFSSFEKLGSLLGSSFKIFSILSQIATCSVSSISST